MHSSHVADIKVRQAICMAIDRDALIAGTFDGAGHVPFVLFRKLRKPCITGQKKTIH